MLAGSIASGSVGHAALVGLLPDGMPDPAFGTAGLVDIGAGPLYSYSANAVALQADGRVVVAGNSIYQGSERDFLLMRFSNAPSPGVVTLGASELTPTSARLRAVVNAGGSDTGVTFQYRELRESAFHSLTPSPSTVTGIAETPVEKTLTGLKRNTVYSYRTIGINASAAITGNEPSFRTLTHHEAWRRDYFGSILNAGAGADDQDFDHHGLVNLLEWALVLDPGIPNQHPYAVSLTAAGLEFTHPRNLLALQDGLIFTTEWSCDPPGPWSVTGVNDTLVSESSGTRIVKSTIPAGTEGRCFVRLQVTPP